MLLEIEKYDVDDCQQAMIFDMKLKMNKTSQKIKDFLNFNMEKKLYVILDKCCTYNEQQ